MIFLTFISYSYRQKPFLHHINAYFSWIYYKHITLSMRKGHNFLINAYQMYADIYLIGLVRTNYLRGGCLIKRIKIFYHRHENGTE